MATATLNRASQSFGDGYDGIVIRHAFEDKAGGATLEASGYARTYIRRGHLIIKAADGTLKPMPLNAGGTAYGTLPDNHTYYGVANASADVQGTGIQVSILQRFAMNHKVVDATAGVFGIPAGILTAVKTALPLATFKGDNE